MTLVLGLDCGLTVTKAVVFDDAGGVAGAACRQSPRHTPRPGWVERDMDELWQTAAEAIRDALAVTGRAATEIAAIGVTGHGDGLYCAHADGTPARPGITSLDSRAEPIARRWRRDGTAGKALALTGQEPDASAPVTVLAWLAENEPDTLRRTRWLLSCKDWIRLVMTGTAGTDPTDASTSFTNVGTQAYDDSVLELFGLHRYAGALPPIVPSTAIAGRVDADAAALTGLAEGTPVMTGVHDVDASAIGSGAVHPGQLSIIAGTYSINQVPARNPRTDPRWFTRNFLEPGTWQHMAISPASVSNLEWFVDEVCRDLLGRPAADRYAELSTAYESVAADPPDVLFLPYLYGGPSGVRANAAFVGVSAWHRREHLLRAVLEGVVFNHRRHVEALAERFDFTDIRLTGGASHAPHWAQLFADALGRTVHVVRTRETGALGVALCALVGLGRYPTIASAVAQVLDQADADPLRPRPRQHAELDRAYRRFLRVTDALNDIDPHEIDPPVSTT